jgi:hypothetical protein
MKKTIGLRAVSAMLALLAFSVLASANTPMAQDQCTPENKLAWYNQFRETFKTDQAKANEVATKYLACPAAAGEEQITSYLKNFVTLYEKASRKGQVTDLVFNKKEYVKAFDLGKQVIAAEPEYLRTYIDLGYAGYSLALQKNTTYVADSLNYSKKALQMIEGGTAPEDWKPFSGKEEALSWLNNIVATFTIQTSPADAIPYFIKAATIEGPFKKTPQTYANLGQAYEVGVYTKMADAYTANFKDKPETPESKLALANINQVVERIIDAHARAVKLAGDDPKNAALKTESMNTLTQWYKYLHNNSDAGLTEMVAGILSKPLPPQPTPLTSLPATAPASPTTGTTTGNGTTGATTQGTGTTAPASSTQGQTATKPAATATPKPKRHHRP